MGQQCCTSTTTIKEDKRIKMFFTDLYNKCEIKSYNINNYKELSHYISTNSQNNFKILNKKQEVRENFVKDLNILFHKEKDENKVLFFILVLTILVSKYTEEHLDYLPDSHDFYIDFEQDLYRILEIILVNNTSKTMLYYTAQLYYHLINITQNIDVYISTEKYLMKLKTGLDSCKNDEFALYKEKFVENFGLMIIRSKVELSNGLKNFALDTIISFLSDNSEKIYTNKDLLLFYYKKDKKSFINDDPELDNLMKSVSLHLDCFHKYLVQFTNDITTGKKLWKIVEDSLKSKLDNRSAYQSLLELVIMYIFSLSKSYNYESGKCKLVFSTIFEFLCDKLSSTTFKIQNAEYVSVNLNLFYEIIYNYVEILIDDILNERYMQFFARIFLEDCLAEVTNKSSEENEKQILLRLYEIISKHQEPLKLYISLINNTGKLFASLKEETYLVVEHKEVNTKLLLKIYTKLNIFLTKYSMFQNYDKATLERDEVLIIISNFSTTNHELKPQYISFFIKFFFFIESHFKIEIDFKHRKNILMVIFEMFFDLLVVMNELTPEKLDQSPGPQSKIWVEEYIKLLELFYVLLKNYSINMIEDAYFIYRTCGAFLRKVIHSYSEFLTEKQLFLVIFLIFAVLNMVCKYDDLVSLYTLVNSSYEGLKTLLDNYTIRDNVEKLFMIVEQNYLMDCLKTLRNSFCKREKSFERKDSLSMKPLDSENQRSIIAKTLVNIHSKFFSNGCPLSQAFDEIMINKGLQVFVKEFSQDMTFREMNKANKEFDSLTEHSFLVSNRDFEFFANDSMKIAFGLEERRSIIPIQFNEKKESNILKSPFAMNQSINFSNQFEIKLKSIEDNEEVENKLSRMSNYAFDEYFKNNDINDLKI